MIQKGDIVVYKQGSFYVGKVLETYGDKLIKVKDVDDWFLPIKRIIEVSRVVEVKSKKGKKKI